MGTGYLSFAVVVLMVKTAALVAPGWDQIAFYIAYFPSQFQLGLENLFSGLWAHLNYYIVISFPGFVMYILFIV
jgi:hypothetical protein